MMRGCACSGTYSLFRHLEKQIKVFENVSAEVGVVYTGMWKIHGSEKKYVIKPEDGIVYKQALDRVRGIGLVALVIKRECFNKVGVFDESLPRFIDLEFFIRLSKYYLFQHIDEPLVNRDTIEGLVKYMKVLYRNSKMRHEIGINAKRVAENKYTIEEYSQNIIDLIMPR